MGMFEPKVRVVSNTNTGSIPVLPLLADNSTDLHKAGLSCNRKSVVRNKCMVSDRTEAGDAVDAIAVVEDLSAFVEEEEPFLAIIPKLLDDR